MRRLLFVLIALVSLVACSAPAETIEVTRLVEQPAATVEVEVTRVVEETVVETVVETVTEEVAVEILALPMVDPLATTGDIVTAGSSTVFPLTEAMAARFQDEGYAGNITIDSVGTGAGFERFCVAGETDISNASRAIKEEEIASCQAIGRNPVEFRVGTDALAIVVSKENTFLTDVTLEQLALIFSTATNWSDVDPSWPAEPIQRFSPGTDSGTFDYFVEEVFGDAGEEPILAAANLQLSEDDNVLVQGVEGSPYAIGYFGYAYYQENAELLNILHVEGVEPTAENVDNGSYPLARPLFIYSDATIMQEKPQVAAFINFYLTYVNDEVTGVGYFPASNAALNTAKQNWTNAIAATDSGPVDEAGVMLPGVDPLAVSGDIVTAGSSTVFPLTEAMAARFQDEGYAGNITIDSVGTGAGFERFCVAGETDISNASRAIKEEEIASCQAIGRNPVEFRVGTDALAIVVSKENTFLTDVTLEQLALIFSTATNWSDVDPSWPAEPIQRFSPGTDSGTFDYFVEEVFGDAGEEPILAAANLQLSEDDNVLVQGVEGSPYAIGYFGYAYYQENAELLNILHVEGVEPTAENVDNGSYPLARPLFIYSDATIMQEKPQVAAFINFYLTYVNDEVTGVGYFPASNAALNTAKQNWTNAIAATDSGPVDEAGVMLPGVDPLAVSGDIVTAGSSTVFPLTEAMAARFQDEGYAGNITIDSVGTGAGFERFCVAGETDISNASRAIKEEEIASCQAIGRNPVEFRVGTDALAIVVSKENTFLTDVTLEQLALIFSTATNWSDVDPSWPAEPIQRFSPGTDSGTFDYFVEEVFGDAGEEPILAAANLQLSEDDNVLVQGVEGSPYAIGYFGYAYYQENAELLNILHVEGVEPTAENVDNGSYPLARPLFIYSDATIMQEKPQVAAFINFYLTYVNEEVTAVGYFPASSDALNQAKINWLNANN